jgi:hypothetical protein
MPYTIRKQKCKQSDGDTGSYVLSYTDKSGKKHRACHTSKKKAQGQIAAIEGQWEADGVGADEEVMTERLLREMVRETLLSEENRDSNQLKTRAAVKTKIEKFLDAQRDMGTPGTGFGLFDAGLKGIATINLSVDPGDKLNAGKPQEQAKELANIVAKKVSSKLTPVDVFSLTFKLAPTIFDKKLLPADLAVEAFGPSYDTEGYKSGTAIELAWVAAARYAEAAAQREGGRGHDMTIGGRSIESKHGNTWNFNIQTTMPKEDYFYVFSRISGDLLQYAVLSGGVLRSEMGINSVSKEQADEIGSEIDRGSSLTIGKLVARQLKGGSGTMTVPVRVGDGGYTVNIKSFISPTRPKPKA